MCKVKLFGSFPFVPPPPPSTLCAPQLQSTCHYIGNHYVKILHVHLGDANNMRPLSWGGGGAQTEKIQLFMYFQFIIAFKFVIFRGTVNVNDLGRDFQKASLISFLIIIPES